MPTLKKTVAAPRGARKTAKNARMVPVTILLPAQLVEDIKERIAPFRLSLEEFLQNAAFWERSNDQETLVNALLLHADAADAGGFAAYYAQERAEEIERERASA